MPGTTINPTTVTTKRIIFALLAFYSSTGFCQINKDNIATQFNAYLTTIIEKDFDKSMNYIEEKFFTIIPRSQLVLLMERTFNNPDYEFNITNPSIDSIGEAEFLENRYYVQLYYSNTLHMRFLNQENETEDERGLQISLMKLSFEKTFGSENVHYNTETEFFEIFSNKLAYAISYNGEDDWKFIVVEPKQKMILEKILPKKITDQI